MARHRHINKPTPRGPCPLCGATDHGSAAHLEPREAAMQVQREFAAIRRATIRSEEWVKILDGLVQRDAETRP